MLAGLQGFCSDSLYPIGSLCSADSQVDNSAGRTQLHLVPCSHLSLPAARVDGEMKGGVGCVVWGVVWGRGGDVAELARFWLQMSKQTGTLKAGMAFVVLVRAPKPSSPRLERPATRRLAVLLRAYRAVGVGSRE
jgi:hypothetical protein